MKKGSTIRLNTVDHSRDSAGLRYVYPVVSRRARGVSVGINLNTNNACNWACVYCQVPGLVLGRPEAVNLVRLEAEFRSFLTELLHGDFMRRAVPEEARRFADVAFSGNGEPTLASEFPEAVDIVIATMRTLGVPSEIPIRLITNGSLLHLSRVRGALLRLAAAGGEVWFKIDRATSDGILATNQVRLESALVRQRLAACAAIAPTWVQTCWFGCNGAAPGPVEIAAYLDLIADFREQIRGVLLYGIARQPMQKGSARLQSLPSEALEAFARQIEACGVSVSVSP